MIGSAVTERAAADRGWREFLRGPVLSVAPALLGCVISHTTPEGTVAVRLTEVEAYDGPGDPGSHARAGLTPRTAVMFGPPGRAYVYFTYGMHWCLNVVTGPDGSASGVLLRGGEVVGGVDLARTRRPAARRDVDLARGPARLANALGVGGGSRGADVVSGGPLRLLGTAPEPGSTAGEVLAGPRTGVSGPGGDGERYPWRFHLAGEASVSPYRAAASKRAGPRRPAE